MSTGVNDTGLAKRLFDEKFLSRETLDNAIRHAHSQNRSLMDFLIEHKQLDFDAFAQATAKYFAYPLFDLSSVDLNTIPIEALGRELISKHQILPLAETELSLSIAMADPANQAALNELQFFVGKRIQPMIVHAEKLARLIKEIQRNPVAVENTFDETELDSIELSDEELDENQAISIETNDAPIIKFVHTILLDAIHKGASDIHFEPYETCFRIRMRLDGILTEVSAPPLYLANRISTRIKVMSKLDIAEKRIPQDGRFKLNLASSGSMDFRVSTCPTLVGEKIVIRLLDPTAASLGTDALGLETQQQALFLKHVHQPQGMILVTGPTGSGKTVTLYTALSLLNTEKSNILTVEDPVEIYMDGINQVSINLKAGLTFSTALRAFLRQDPDIIMVGEMRDLETAEIGVKAAQTGHLVLSTLHTNSASETLSRLANMGLPAYNIATSVSMIIAQRLARTLCGACKIEDEFALAALKKETLGLSIDQKILYTHQPKGCELCNNGFKGRTGIFEILSITDEMRSAILAGANSMEFLKLGKAAGMQTLREAGLNKVIHGETSLDEINRITNH